MKIRAITYFTALDSDPEKALSRAGDMLRRAQDAFAQAGLAVESRRVASQPLPRIGIQPAGASAFALKVQQAAKAHGIGYVSLGPVGPDDVHGFVHALPDVFGATEGIFASVAIADKDAGVDLAHLGRAAETILRTSRAGAGDGLGNLYLCASANVPPGSPFFPAAYHDGGEDRFALAIEAAGLAVTAFQYARDPRDARERLTAEIQAVVAQILPIAEHLSIQFGVDFGGLDFSMAPYPGDATSLAGAVESLGVAMGGAGVLAAAALVMNAIEAADFPRTGFSGLMLPVFEDSVLGARVSEGALRLNDLLLYSAMCGTGLDCIPLPGDVSLNALTGILLDVASLALRLDKPLTARLMPMPGKAAGDPVAFDFEYFAPTRVMPAPRDLGESGALASGGRFPILPRE
ncbi:MAG: DUF711 family protein [Anaerolineae bacterium]|nr:DUF711 family protein [Anaerolineae bacterium]